MNFSLCKKFSETYGTPRGLMGMVMFHVCVPVAASLQLRICSDICLILYTCELPLLILVRGKRLLKDWMVILDIASCMKVPEKKINLISKAEQLLNGSHAKIGETNFPLTE